MKYLFRIASFGVRRLWNFVITITFISSVLLLFTVFVKEFAVLVSAYILGWLLFRFIAGREWLNLSIIVTTGLIVWMAVAVYVPALREPKRPFLEGITWNPANASVPIWNYQNGSIKTIIWNPSNPSYEDCSTYKGPQYRPDSELAGYNPAPNNLAWNPQPYCWSCHSNSYVGYYNYTALAHPGGNPVGYGEM